MLGRRYRFLHNCALAGIFLLAWVSFSPAQGFGGGSGGGSGGGALGGSGGGALGSSSGSSGGVLGSSSGSGILGSSSGSGVLGSTSGSLTGSTTGTGLIGSSSNSIGMSGTSRSTGFSGGSNTSTGVSRANPFYSYYGYALSKGMPSGTTAAAFGTPIYGNLITTTTTPSLGRTTGGGSGSGASNTAPRSPRYSVKIGFARTKIPPTKLKLDASQALANSTTLNNAKKIDVAMDGETVVLRGSVDDDHDRRLAEGLVRLTPGVYEVRNELQIKPTGAAPVGGSE